MKRFVLLLSLLTGIAYADTIGLNVNNHDVEMEGTLNLSSIGYDNGISYFLGTHYLHTANDNLVKISFGASSPLSGAEGLTLAFGLEALFAENFAALPFWGKAVLRLPLDEPIPPISLAIAFNYAPSVLSFVDADRYSEYRFEADMEVIHNIHIYGGYRHIDTDYESYDHTFNESWYGGMKIGF